MDNLENEKLEALLKLLPPEALKKRETVAHEIFRAVVIRCNFVTGVRHRLGWNGVSEIVSSASKTGTITSKIRGVQGVYGLLPVETRVSGRAKFSLFYFPSTREEVIENFSVKAGIIASQEDFIPKVRNFPLYPEFCTLFYIGSIESEIDENGKIFLSLTALKRSKTISENGIRIKTVDNEVELVPEMGVDQDLFSFDLAMPFFRAVASSFTFLLQAPPEYLMFRSKELLKRETQNENFKDKLVLGFMMDNSFVLESSDQSKFIWRKGEKLKYFTDEPWWGDFDSISLKSPNDTSSINKPRFIILTGFLGAGKTTFLDNFIQEHTSGNRFVAVIQNEIGKKGLDKKLLTENHAITEMDEGCVCCTLSGNLRAALNDILQNHTPDFVVLETTGAANPANVLSEMDDLDDILEFSSVTAVIDVSHAEENLSSYEVARSQVRLADNILLNKCDLVKEDNIDRVEQVITGLNPVAKVFRTTGCNIRASQLYGINYMDKPKRPVFLNAGEIGSTHSHDEIETFILEPKDRLNRSLLMKTIEERRKDILRIKGIVNFSDIDGKSVFQYASGITSIEPFKDEEEENFLVFIGRNVCRLKDEFEQK